MKEHPRCLICKWWDQDTRRPEEHLVPANQLKWAVCRRHPSIEWKHSTEWCGEHSVVTDKPADHA